MSRKHYISIAAALKETGASIETVKAIAAVMKSDNTRFDVAKFLAACGY